MKNKKDLVDEKMISHSLEMSSPNPDNLEPREIIAAENTKGTKIFYVKKGN